MTSSPSLGRPIVALVAILALAACASTSPSSGAPSPSGGATAALGTASITPSTGPDATPSSAATDSPEPVASDTPTATPTPDPTETPTTSPRPVANPTPRPTSAPAATCGTGQAGFAAAHERPQVLQFGGATIEYTPAGFGMLDGSFGGDDAIPGGIGLSPKEIAVVVGPGDHIILRAKGLTLRGTSATASPWSEVTFEGGLASLGGAKTTLAWRFRSDGSLSISAPDGVGDWAIEFFPSWQGACTWGGGTAYARIKVR